MSLFQFGSFALHSGGKSSWKIDCDCLTHKDWESLALLTVTYLVPEFSQVLGIPRGGLEFARALEKYKTFPDVKSGLPTLLVDDVLTTGQSMETMKALTKGEVLGVVVFARGTCPSWVNPLFEFRGGG